MHYLMMKGKGQFKIVDYKPECGYVAKGSKKELELFLDSAPADKDQARQRQVEFLKGGTTDQGFNYILRRGDWTDDLD